MTSPHPQHFEAYRALEAVPSDFGPCVAAIGNFDGVHLGHQAILRRTVELGRESGMRAVVLTFDPHPTRVVAPERAPALMTTVAQRLDLFAAVGLDAAVIAPFTLAFSRMEPEQFVETVLVDRLGCRTAVVGENFRFGRRHAGDVDTLRSLGKTLGFTCEAIGPVRLGGEIVSSSRIRQAVGQGRMAAARKLLGRCFALTGKVVPGRGVGTRSTVPTLNLAPDAELLPGDGVYVTETFDPKTGNRWPSVSNVGVRPTFGESERVVETHLLAPLEGDGPAEIEVRFLRRLREERRFESAALLREQILLDVGRTRRYFALRRSVDELVAARKPT